MLLFVETVTQSGVHGKFHQTVQNDKCKYKYKMFSILCLYPYVPGSKPKASDANFDDLLSGQGFSGAKEKKGPRTIAEMRKEEMAKEMDPEKLKAGDIAEHALMKIGSSLVLMLFVRNTINSHDSLRLSRITVSQFIVFLHLFIQ